MALFFPQKSGFRSYSQRKWQICVQQADSAVYAALADTNLFYIAPDLHSPSQGPHIIKLQISRIGIFPVVPRSTHAWYNGNFVGPALHWFWVTWVPVKYPYSYNQSQAGSNLSSVIATFSNHPLIIIKGQREDNDMQAAISGLGCKHLKDRKFLWLCISFLSQIFK